MRPQESLQSCSNRAARSQQDWQATQRVPLSDRPASADATARPASAVLYIATCKRMGNSPNMRPRPPRRPPPPFSSPRGQQAEHAPEGGAVPRHVSNRLV
jgi:hypothetical protein